MPVPYNSPSRLRRRREGALARVQASIKAYTNTPDKEGKLETAKTVEANIKANLISGR